MLIDGVTWARDLMREAYGGLRFGRMEFLAGMEHTVGFVC